MLLAPCSAMLSAQSPPWSRKASPAATRPSAFIRLRASPANTRGGNVASCFSISASFAGSGYCGTWTIGFLRQLSGVQRSAMTALPFIASLLRLYTSAGLGGEIFSPCSRAPPPPCWRDTAVALDGNDAQTAAGSDAMFAYGGSFATEKRKARGDGV